MKKAIISVLIGAMISVVAISQVYCGLIETYVEDNSWIEEDLNIEFINVGMLYKNKYIVTNNNAALVNGRIYVPIKDVVTGLGGSLKSEGNVFNIILEDKKAVIPMLDSNKIKTMIYSSGVGYVNLFSLLEKLDMVPAFDSINNRIDIYHRQSKGNYETGLRGYEKTAYIRLEDIMADGQDAGGKYTDIGLEKLRYMGEYMYERGQEYYIAWIPVYNNPKTGVINDISKNYNLYNAGFIYTLDYLQAKGGHIGLHGYTHQYGDEKSADGYEFGENTPYSDTECMTRMVEAKKAANKLGYVSEFFEFPHYGATAKQMEMAEHYFDVIYQSYPREDLKNIVTYSENENGRNYYIPTPVDYIYYYDDVEGVKRRMTEAESKGYAVSLFFHPTIDFKDLTISTTSDDIRKWEYNSERVLPQVVDKVLKDGYRFGTLNK